MTWHLTLLLATLKMIQQTLYSELEESVVYIIWTTRGIKVQDLIRALKKIAMVIYRIFGVLITCLVTILITLPVLVEFPYTRYALVLIFIISLNFLILDNVVTRFLPREQYI